MSKGAMLAMLMAANDASDAFRAGRLHQCRFYLNEIDRLLIEARREVQAAMEAKKGRHGMELVRTLVDIAKRE